MGIHERSDSEVCAAIDALLEVHTPEPYRTTAVAAACVHRPSVAAIYLPLLIKELEAAIAESPARPLELTLEQTRTLCDRLGVSY